MKEQLLHFLNQAFEMEQEATSFQEFLPKLYGTDYSPCASNYILKEDNTIKAAVGAYDGILHMNEHSLLYRGIGNVAVGSEFRQKGYMKECMTATITQAIDDDIDFLVLGGQRQRYQYFGFEYVGMEYRVTISQVNLRHALYGIPYEPFEIRDVTKNDFAFLEQMYQLHKRKSFRSHRTLEMFYDILCSWNARPKVILKHGSFAGYFTGVLQELTLISNKDFPNFIRAYMQNRDEIEFIVNAWDFELLTIVRKFCENIELCENEMFNILNYKHVLHAFLQFSAEQIGLSDGEQNFLIHGYNRDFKLHISVKNNLVWVEEKDFNPSTSIECSHFEAMELFFGFHSSRRRELKPEIRSWFPLPIYIEAADQV